ncbi:MAG: ABC transporter substrate-binding protein [Gammaproteobacteria bacterium]|nr:ABC transporter substrate-binding protein [Gammaproteobacteria bacterium]
MTIYHSFQKLSLLLLLGLSVQVGAQTQGVEKDSILVGSIQDLSGPGASYGKQARFGMMLRVDEINEQGGIHGRKLILKVEDSGYDPKKALLAAQKLVNQDKIFIMLAHIGTTTNLATMPVQFEKNVINFMPLAAARQMYEPFHKLKFALLATYYDQMRAAVPVLVKEKNAKVVCTLYQDDEFGLEVATGGEDGLKKLGMTYAEKTTYKRGATDFSSQVAKLKSSHCDFVVLGTILRETIGTLSEAKKIGFNPVFLGSNTSYTDLIHKLGGKTVEGFYATMTTQNPYTDDISEPIRLWANKYKTKFNEDPNVISVYGYTIMDIFALATSKVGTDLTTENFIKAMDTLQIPRDIFGGPEISFGPTKRLGSDESRISQIKDGKWVAVSNYTKP